MKKEKTLSILIKIIAIAVSVYGLYRSFGKSDYFTYFTNLSNIAIDLVLAVSLILVISNKKPAKAWYIIKYLFTISIMLTFLIYLAVLAPTDKDGFINAYIRNYCGSLCVHFIGPVLAILDFIIFDKNFKSKKRYALYAVIPPLIYVGYVVILAQCFGFRWGDNMMAPYNFINYGAPCGWFGFDLGNINSTTLGIGTFYMIIILCAIFILLGILLLWLNKRAHKK